ncbi:transporter substrate-binding domain-containing protein [Xylophilus rhododendri]|uniref:Transporter substrate-binding domain-containing protein n=1 Tax=Xylophilus rhododendri TaxID=2697032 RepID=A0A857J5Q5_9BURK|nr:ABC transporter substrate-binding protein [Xylophilus rhododendri]QHI98321.1 transporter substrate-binding domain-containing protein [Xylophilus rhododendri]
MRQTPSLHRRRIAAATLLLPWFAGCASPAAGWQASPEAIAALAPTGRLRASINLGNPVLARREASGELAGVSIDLARELGRRLGVPVDLMAVDSAGRSVEVVRGANADIGFFAIDPLRGEGVAFTAAYVVIEGAYMVRADSPLQANAEVDRPGRTVAVGKGSAYDLYLSREIKQATLVRIPTSPKVVDEFMAQKLDVAAGVRQQLEADAKRTPGVRLLPGRFMVIEQAMGVPAGRPPLAQQSLRRFVEEMKASGFVARSLQRHGIEGAAVAPAA